MIRMILIPLFALASAAGAQTCEYKPVMTDAEIEACRHPAALQKPLTSSKSASTIEPGTQSTLTKEAAAAESRARADYAARRQQEREAARAEDAKVPFVPHIGMTSQEAKAMVAANERRLNAAVNGGDKPVDYRYSEWISCEVNRTTNVSGVHEQWVCGPLNVRKYMYFDNGVMTSIQD
jgi:hypothetical protein